jgi:hypothetical protein
MSELPAPYGPARTSARPLLPAASQPSAVHIEGLERIAAEIAAEGYRAGLAEALSRVDSVLALVPTRETADSVLAVLRGQADALRSLLASRSIPSEG